MASLTPQQRAYVRKRSKVYEPGPDELDDELNIVPFLDIVINLIMFLLMVTSTIAFYTQLESTLPSYGSGGSRGSDAGQKLNLSVFVTGNGIIVTGEAGKLLPGCTSVGSGDVITIPLQNGEQNWSELTNCVATVRDFADSQTPPLDYRNADGVAQLTVSADPDIEYQELLWAMDAVRQKDGEELFPAILIAAGLR